MARRTPDLERLTSALPALGVDSSLDSHSAAEVYRVARRGGLTVRGLADCLIAVLAQRHGATLVHRDTGFSALAELPAVPQVDLR